MYAKAVLFIRRTNKLIKHALKLFIKYNISASESLTPRHVRDAHAYVYFDQLCRVELLSSKNKRILDIGAGKQFHFDDLLRDRADLCILGQDISIKEMEGNASLSARFTCDACENIPVEDASLDLILARATVEHLHDANAFLQLAYRKLRPGGKLIVTFAGKWANFAILNRLLPERAKLFLLHTLVPGSRGVLGFPAHYDNSSFRSFSSAGRAAGYIEEVGYVSYYGISYFRFFVPLFLLAYFIDSVRLFVGIRNLSSYNTFVFVRPAPSMRSAEATTPSDAMS